MIRRLPAVTLAAALLVGGCGHRPPDPRGVDRDETLLSVNASGRADARPDEARFQAGVTTYGATARAASEQNAATMQKVVAAVAGFGVAEKDLQTRTLTVSRVGYGPRRGQFEAANVVEVKLRQIDKAGEAVSAITEAGANLLSGPDLRVADPEGASRSAYANAYKAARARAEAYAGAAGLKIARVLAIRDGGAGPQPFAQDAMYEARAPMPVSAPPVLAGVSTSQVAVQVDFALAAK